MNTMISTTGASMLRTLNTDYKDLFEQNNFESIAKKLLEKDPDERRRISAEINSIESIVDEKFILELKNLHILISDTETGKKIGEILKIYFQNSKKYKFENVLVEKIERLDDSNRNDFKRYGLKNLIKKMAEINRKNYGKTLINATGGYKAQIAFALALGQGINIPVYYMFERFPTVIEMPPLPLTLDTSYYIDYIYFFEIFEDEGFMDYTLELEQQYKTLPEQIKILFNIEKIDQKKYIELNPMGQTFLESCKQKLERNEKQLKLEKRKNENIIFQNKNNEAHAEEIILKYNVKKEFEKLNFIEMIYVIGNSETDRGRIPHKAKIMNDEIKCSIYTKKGILDFKIKTTAKNKEELILAKNLILNHIENKFRK